MPSHKQQSVFQGDSFYVSCSSTSDSVSRLMWTGPEGQQITNYKGSVPYYEMPRIHVEDGRALNNGVDLVFDNITRKDRGKYSCSANVDGSEESLSFNLFVYKKIDFMDTPSVQYLKEDHSSELYCNVDGDPMPTVSWTVRGKKIAYGDKYTKGPSSSSLIVNNVTLEDGGDYQCNAVQLSDKISEMEDFKLAVKVHHKPMEEEDGMKQAYSYMTGKVNLTCGAKAEPEAEFTWMKDGQVIENSDTAAIINDGHQSVLQLTVIDDEQFGDYECKAENDLGTLERVIVLEKGKKPPTPEFKVARADVNTLHLELTAAQDPVMPILAYRVQYKEAGIEWSHAPAVEFKNGDEYVINSLEDDTLYVLRAAARNAAGYSDFSDDAMKRTEKDTGKPHTSQAIGGSSYVSLNTFTFILTLVAMAAHL
ncbi:hypothetical protein Pcinc_037217 [Petrolisthes cinctipes]|uniref:Neural cell adhesion molecule 1 n=1 Tax=Petrolisthes cinctipes TaxID=88211 RepID=A0AAE1EL73_PETCI|nr:hypothetical protein Pcinc_037217 [Petrolisthes cinctipes]